MLRIIEIAKIHRRGEKISPKLYAMTAAAETHKAPLRV